jgi:hypothetical protein
MRTAAGVVMVATSAVLLVGCAEDNGAPASADVASVASTTPPSEPGTFGEAMRVDVYDRMEDLSAESQVVLVGTVRSIAQDGLNGVPSNRVQVAVERSARGSVPEEVTIVELPNMGPDFPPPLEVGRTYLLYLVDTTLKEHPEHHYYVSGISGVFAVEGDQVRRLDPGSPKLPEVQDLEPLLEAAATEVARPQRTVSEDLQELENRTKNKP